MNARKALRHACMQNQITAIKSMDPSGLNSYAVNDAVRECVLLGKPDALRAVLDAFPMLIDGEDTTRYATRLGRATCAEVLKSWIVMRHLLKAKFVHHLQDNMMRRQRVLRMGPTLRCMKARHSLDAPQPCLSIRDVDVEGRDVIIHALRNMKEEDFMELMSYM